MRRTLAAVALTASLVTAASPGTFGRLWELLSPFWDSSPSFSTERLHTKAGCEADPNGSPCEAEPTEPQTKAGCEADPDGRCKSGS